jgi:triosephosphate isomerase
MRTKLVAGNWKMHGSLPDNATLLGAVRDGVADLRASLVAVCVPFPYLFQVQQALTGSRVAWGGQTVSQHAKGAFTGEVSAGMLREFGCTYVIVGHSERRTLFAEDDAAVAAKFAAALQAGLTPILCVGETQEQRDAGVTQATVESQLSAVIDHCGVSALGRAAVAYEPLWAIGTGRTATPGQAQEVHAFLRGCIAVKDAALAQQVSILYGGSVKASNAADLFAMPDIDGGLVGGAALLSEEFVAICRSAERHAG